MQNNGSLFLHIALNEEGAGDGSGMWSRSWRASLRMGPAACFVHTALHRISLSQAVARLGVEVCVGDGLWLVNAQQLLMFVANKPHSQAVVRCNVAFCRRHPGLLRMLHAVRPTPLTCSHLCLLQR